MPIVSNPLILEGAPTIAGTRIPVAAIKGLAADGYGVAAVIAEYPGLTPSQVLEAADWQPAPAIEPGSPMDTAPRDGTHILVETADFGMVEAWWDPEELDFYANTPGTAGYEPGRRGAWVSHFTDAEGDRRLYCGGTPKCWHPRPPTLRNTCICSGGSCPHIARCDLHVRLGPHTDCSCEASR